MLVLMITTNKDFYAYNNSINQTTLVTIDKGEFDCNCPIISDDDDFLLRKYLKSHQINEIQIKVLIYCCIK